MDNHLNQQAIQSLNGSALAYMGDSVFEQAVRHHVLVQGGTQVQNLHKAAVKFVSAQAQARIMHQWLADEQLLTADEITIYKRGRNHKANTKAKNASIGDYRQATGFEALLGWLYLTQQDQRLAQLIALAIKMIEEED
ncbi:Mini-ribonuclease 3 [Vaginisenegalia massiliensis]|uniref:Mini-ribonuclease 3 n=1 Tax=Vaginisenegalia massiliensis TaxID=2058294 RepID=UPI0019D28E96|nr:ribonuclease III domain-containing protein [Vaginisenegalia massiliensis]